MVIDTLAVDPQKWAAQTGANVEDTLSLRAAAKVAGVSHETVRKWCKKYPGVGHRDGQLWRISKPEVLKVARAYRQALEFLGRAA